VDDLGLIGNDMRALESKTNVLVGPWEEMNVEKANYIITNGNRNISKNESTEKINKFKYLGSFVASKN